MRVLQEIDDLFELVLGLVGPGDVAEGDLRGVRRDELRLGAAELERLVPASLHRPQEPEPEEDQDEPWKRRDQEAPPRCLLRLGANLDGTTLQVGQKALGDLARKCRLEEAVLLPVARDGLPELAFDPHTLDHRHGFDVAASQLGAEIGVGEFVAGRLLTLRNKFTNRSGRRMTRIQNDAVRDSRFHPVSLGSGCRVGCLLAITKKLSPNSSANASRERQDPCRTPHLRRIRGATYIKGAPVEPRHKNP